MMKIRKYLSSALCIALLLSASLVVSSKGNEIKGNGVNSIQNQMVTAVNNSELAGDKKPDIKRKETEISDKSKIKEIVPYKVELPSIDLEDLKEVKQSLNVIDYTFINTPADIPKQSSQDHRVETIYKGNGQRALMIMQVEESMKPFDLLNDCEKITIKGADAYVYDPQPNLGISVIQIMFWKDGKYFNVMGRDLSKEKLIKIAESLK